jgi:glycosyltransferase involved in cell wall biosynthesis
MGSALDARGGRAEEETGERVMRRILLLIKGLGRGGAEYLLAAAVRRGDRERFLYEVAYLLPWKDALVSDIEALGVQVHCLEGGRGVAWVGRMRSLVQDRGLRLVHAHSPYPAVAARMALPGGTRLVYTEHNVWPRYRWPTYWGNLLTFGRNDHVFAVSDQVRASVRYPAALRSLPMPPVETLYHGVDVDEVGSGGSPDGVRAELGIPADAPLVGTVGSLTPKKDHETFLRAAAALRREHPDVRVVVVGQGPLEGRLRRLIRDLGMEHNVILAGYRDDALRVTAALDVFVLSSRFEGLPISVLEAMALGRPVVATQVGGIAEVVRPGRDGLLVPPGDAGAIAQAVADILQDSDLRLRMGEQARKRASDFDIEAAIRRQEALYEKLLG